MERSKYSSGAQTEDPSGHCRWAGGTRVVVVSIPEQQEGCWARCHACHNNSYPSSEGCHQLAHHGRQEHTLGSMYSSHSLRIAIAPISEMRKPRRGGVSDLPTGPQAVRVGLEGGSWHVGSRDVPPR